LLNLVEKLPKDSDVIFVGDLCDRGLYSKEVISFVIENNYRCVKGNHDTYMIKYAKAALEEIENKWTKEYYMGGKETMKSYKYDKETLFKHIEFLKTLPSYILLDKYFITHGFGLPYYEQRDTENTEWSLLINREDSDEKYKKIGMIIGKIMK
jgi:serine/threonine protein phosphatase 1